jgi:hypothetical protein
MDPNRGYIYIYIPYWLPIGLQFFVILYMLGVEELDLPLPRAKS